MLRNGFGRVKCKSVSQIPKSTRRLRKDSDKGLYVGPEYQEVYPPVEGHTA